MLKKLLASITALTAAIFVTAVPAHATTVTLFSVSTYGWSSGYHHYLMGPPGEDMQITITRSGSSSCNSGSDYYKVKLTNYIDGGQVVDFYDSYQGGIDGSFSTTSDVANSSYGSNFVQSDYQNVYWYVGPQSACHLTLRIWANV